MKAFSIFKEIKHNNKILLIISDGLLNDVTDIKKAQDDIQIKIEELQLITVCVYLNCSNKYNDKRFYNEKEFYKNESNYNKGAKFLFNISSKLDYHNSIIKYFIKNNWKIPSNGICKLFIEINNSQDLNQFIDLLNKSIESLEYNEPKEKINAIIGNAFLDKIVEENYIKQFKAEDQRKNIKNQKVCFQYGISAAIYLASISVFGRKIDNFENIRIKVKNYFEEKKIKEDEFFEKVEKIVKNFKLRAK